MNPYKYARERCPKKGKLPWPGWTSWFRAYTVEYHAGLEHPEGLSSEAWLAYCTKCGAGHDIPPVKAPFGLTLFGISWNSSLRHP